MEKKTSNFSGQIGFVLAAAGSAVGVGNLWRFRIYLGDRGAGGISAGAFHRPGDREHLFSGAGYGTDQGDHWLPHGEE